jgi:predicted metal-dependent HD superfamily phosphohydrolase
MLDEVRFRGLWHRLGGRDDPSALFARLQEAYSKPQRGYHTAAHIEDCLARLDSARGEAERPDEVEVALWFHDAVYDPRAADNEERSAAWAAQAMREGGMDPEAVRRVSSLIEATKHRREPDTPDCALLLDVDLSILGQPPEAFAAYEARIRQEYAWVPQEQFRLGRRAILESFLKRPAIYRTEFFRTRLEAQARENLARSIAQLQG